MDLPATASLLEARVSLLVEVEPVGTVDTEIVVDRAVHGAHNRLKSSEDDISDGGQGGEER
jgi:hypothetical protein